MVPRTGTPADIPVDSVVGILAGILGDNPAGIPDYARCGGPNDCCRTLILRLWTEEVMEVDVSTFSEIDKST